MNFNIVQGSEGIAELDWAKPTDIFTNVFISMNVQKGSLFTDPNFGLDLSDIKKVTDSKVLLIEKRIIAALSWLLEVGKARALKVVVQKNQLVYNRVDIKIEIIQADNVPFTIDSFIIVGSS